MSDPVKTHYQVDCECSNCGYVGPVPFTLGCPVPPDRITCPGCMCFTCKKVGVQTRVETLHYPDGVRNIIPMDPRYNCDGNRSA